MVLVSAVLDNPGNPNHGVMTHVLVKDDGIVSDAMNMFNKQPLQEIFSCDAVELAGIVPEEKISDPNAKLRIVGPSSALSACYKDDLCFIVKPSTKEQDPGSGDIANTDQEVVARAAKVSPATTIVNRSPQSASMSPTSAVLQVFSNANNNHNVARACASGTSLTEAEGTRKPRPSGSDILDLRRHSSSKSEAASECKAESEAEALSESEEESVSEEESDSEAESTQQSSTDNENAEQSFEDGTKHFVRWRDGVEYPVTLLSSQSNGMCSVRYDNYGSQASKVNMNKLLPFTKKRKRDFDTLWEKTKAETKKKKKKSQEAAKKKSEQRKRAKEQVRQAKRKEERQKARLDRAQALKEAKEKEKAHRQRFGKRLPRTGIPPCDVPGIVRTFETRRIYYAEDDEQPVVIADAFDIDVDCLLYHNRGNYPNIEKNSRLKPGTPIVLPPADD
jgi:hypothetical protein